MSIRYSDDVLQRLAGARPGDLLGHRKDGTPFFLMAGGSDESDIDAGGDEGGDEDERGEDEDGAQDDRPSLEEWRRFQKAHAKAKAEAKKYRLKANELEASSSKDGSDQAVQQARTEAAAEVESKYKKTVVRTAAKAELVAAGAKPEKVDRIIRLLDMERIDVDEDGDVLGLEDEVKAIKKDYPELFGKRTSRDADGADKSSNGTGKPKSSAAKLVAGWRR